MAAIMARKGQVVKDPAIVQKLLASPLAAWLWVLPRIWVGWQWIQASEHKLADPKWVVSGEALKGFWLNAVKIPETGRPAIAFDWYRTFLQYLLDTQSYTWFAKLVAYGEFAIGAALIIGAFVGIAALFGALMNWNFMMAGTASTNPLLFAVAVLLILSWKVAGYYGFDRFLLPLLGTPWKPGKAFNGRNERGAAETA